MKYQNKRKLSFIMRLENSVYITRNDDLNRKDKSCLLVKKRNKRKRALNGKEKIMSMIDQT